MSKAVILSGRSVLKLSGPDTRKFLQGLITNNAEAITDTSAKYAALLTPQGKIISDFILAAAGEDILIDCATEHAADLTQRLSKYKLRAKVSIENTNGSLTVLSAHTPPSSNANIIAAFEDPRLKALGFRWIVDANKVTAVIENEHLELEPLASYDRHRIECGVPDAITDLEPESYFPLDCNFEELHGVDFDKGCYVGQELTSRMKHRATSRRRILPVAAAQSLPPRGTKISVNGVEAGEMLGAQGVSGLAIIRLDKLADATTATAGAIQINIGRPPYPFSI